MSADAKVGAEATMWAAVVKLAFTDACNPADPTARPTCGCTPREAAEAWEFLTAQKGEAAKQRRWIAGLNGFDETIITADAIRRGPSRKLRAYRVWIDARSKIAGRGREIIYAYERGQPMAEIAKLHGISIGRVNQIVAQPGVKRRMPPSAKARA